eukprot:739496-Rhodomonas_salina.1
MDARSRYSPPPSSNKPSKHHHGLPGYLTEVRAQATVEKWTVRALQYPGTVMFRNKPPTRV